MPSRNRSHRNGVLSYTMSTTSRRWLGFVALAVFLGLPVQAGALFVCKMTGAASAECCCKPAQRGENPTVREDCCCSQTRWPAASAAAQAPVQAQLPAPLPPLLAGRLPAPRPLSHLWARAASLPVDPMPPPLYLSACSFLI
jgi:hypothetical protein